MSFSKYQKDIESQIYYFYMRRIISNSLLFFLAPQVAPRNFKLTAVSPYCVSLSYDPVLYPNGPESGLVYQVLRNISS